MNIVIFGASGMVGQGVLTQCLQAIDVKSVTTIGRSKLPQSHDKLNQWEMTDLHRIDDADMALSGFDACFFCLGGSSSGLSEQAYHELTYDLTLKVATALVARNRQMTFVYVSGAGSDSSEQGRVMWARVKGKTENALKQLPFSSVYLFRPSIIAPLNGIESKTASYRHFYRLTRPIIALLRRFWSDRIVTTDDVGQAMLNAARERQPRVIVEAQDIIPLARKSLA